MNAPDMPFTQFPCTSCGDDTEWICERHDTALCELCECAWVRQHSIGWRHIPKGLGTPFLRYYMNQWPRHLPPPKTKRRARAAIEITPFVEHMLDAVCERLLPAWDREDALMAIAEVAVRVHARDARVIDAWNKFVKSENSKRHFRRMKGWRNNYYTRIIGDDDRPRDDRQPE